MSAEGAGEELLTLAITHGGGAYLPAPAAVDVEKRILDPGLATTNCHRRGYPEGVRADLRVILKGRGGSRKHNVGTITDELDCKLDQEIRGELM
jgi:hypothetical protein